MERFPKHLKERALKGVHLRSARNASGLVESIAEAFPPARWQWLRRPLRRKVFTVVPKATVSEVAC
jgi:transposase-like protein